MIDLVWHEMRLQMGAGRVSRGDGLDGLWIYLTRLGCEDRGAGAFAVEAEESHGIGGKGG